MFFDLNIPFLESDRLDRSKNKTLNGSRRKAVARAMELGYTAVAYDRPFRGVMSDSERCKIPNFTLPLLLEVSPNLPSATAFHRDIVGVSRSSPFRQYTRITIAVDKLSASTAFNSKSILRSYDLVAARPIDQDAFDRVCQVSEVDIIALEFPLKLRLKLPMVQAAIKRGVHFEITYSNLIADVHMRRQILSDVRLLVEWTRGKNLIISSSATSANEIRGPYDVANLSSFLLGLSMERAKATISRNCSSLVANALRKKDHKEAIRIERILPDEKLDSNGVWLCDSNDWDPMSSGDGDLPPLDDISKLFAAAGKLTKSSLAIDFTSCIDSLPFKNQTADVGENLLLSGKKSTIFLSKEPVSTAVNEVPLASVKEAAYAGRLDEVLVKEKKSVAVMPLGLKTAGCECNQVSLSDMPRLYAAPQELVAAVSYEEHPQSPNRNNVASDAFGTPSSNIILKRCTLSGESKVVPPAFDMSCVSAVDNFDPSTMCMEHLRDSDGLHVPSVALKSVTPKEQISEKVVEKELKNEVSSADEPLQMNVVGTVPIEERETCFTMFLESDTPKEQILEKVVEKELKNEVLNADVPLQMDAVGPVPIEEQIMGKMVEQELKNEVFNADVSLQTDGLGPTPIVHDDEPFEDDFYETIEQEQGEVMVHSDVPMKDVLDEMEKQNQQGSATSDGDASYMLRSGRGKRKGRLHFPVYPLPFKGLLKPMVSRKKLCQSRRSRRHL